MLISSIPILQKLTAIYIFTFDHEKNSDTQFRFGDYSRVDESQMNQEVVITMK